jgi:hypothetical protein
MALIFIENFYISVCVIVIVYRSILALALAALFILSSVSAQYQIQPPEVNTFDDFVRAMLLAVPAIIWNYVSAITMNLFLPCRICISPFIRFIVSEENVVEILEQILGIACAPIFAVLSLPIPLFTITVFPSISCLSFLGTVIDYCIPLAFPNAGEFVHSIMGLILPLGLILPAFPLFCCFAILIVPITIFLSPLYLMAISVALLFELIWLPIIAPLLLLFAFIIRTQYQGAELFIESMRGRVESLRTRAEDFVKGTTESCLTMLVPSLEPYF